MRLAADARVKVLGAGMGVSVQDGGRRFFQRYGVTAAGPMDVLAHRRANIAAGAAPDAAAIEISAGGLEISIEGGPLGIAFIGGGFRVKIDGAPAPEAFRATLQPEQVLSVRPGASGAWAYLSFSGRLDLPAVLGSLSTHARARIGGYRGRFLQAGDQLDICDRRVGPTRLVALKHQQNDAAAPIDLILGPQDDFFESESVQRLFSQAWTLDARSDRMAYSLVGAPLKHNRKGFNIVSDGVAFGAVQAPGDGLPYILMADRAPTGGYPKIAHVIAADLGRLAQRRPNDVILFRRTCVEAAVEKWRRALAATHIVEEADCLDLTSERLLSHNLIDGFVAVSNNDETSSYPQVISKPENRVLK